MPYNKKYQLVLTQSAERDIKDRKKYILKHFKYRDYAENFSNKIKQALLSLNTFPTGYGKTKFSYRGRNIYLKTFKPYLIFYTVNEPEYTVTVLRILQDRMNWEQIIKLWLHNWQ